MKKFIISVFYLIVSMFEIYAQDCDALSFVKYGKNINGFGDNNGTVWMGSSGTIVGDIDGNGVYDMAAYAYDFGVAEGNVYIILLNKNLSVKSKVRIGQNRNGFPNVDLSSYFGKTCPIGDLDKDGVPDIAISDSEKGVIFILFLKRDGTIKATSSFSGSDLGFSNGISFGWSLDSLGDFSKDGGIDLVIGAIDDDDGGQNKGAIFIVNLSQVGTTQTVKKISATVGGVHGNSQRWFGIGANCIGDLNADGVTDLVVSSDAQNHPYYSNEEFWILFLNNNGTVLKYQKIDKDSGNLNLPINTILSGFSQPKFIGDMNGDGHGDIMASAYGDTINGKAIGNSYILFLDSLGKVKNTKRLFSDTSSIYTNMEDGDQFGTLSGKSDLDGDYKNDILMSASQNDLTGANEGILFIVSLDGAIHPVQPQSRFISKDTTGLTTKTFTFTNTSAGYPKQVKWSFTPNTVTYQNGTTDTSLDSVQVKFSAAGTYSVKLWVQNPFGQDSVLKTNYIVVNPVGGFEELGNHPFSVYPVPATTELMVSVSEKFNGLVSLSIQNCIGETITTESRLFTSHTSQKINTAALPQGVYFLHLEYNHTCYIQKFVK